MIAGVCDFWWVVWFIWLWFVGLLQCSLSVVSWRLVVVLDLPFLPVRRDVQRLGGFGFEFVVWLLIFDVAGDMFDCVWIWYCCCNMSLRRVSGLLFWWFGFLVAVGFMFACIGGLCRFGFVFWLFGFGRRLGCGALAGCWWGGFCLPLFASGGLAFVVLGL